MRGHKFIYLFYFLPLMLFAVQTPPSKIIDVQASLEKDQVVPEQILSLNIKVDVIKDHYLYLDKFEIVWPANFPAKNTRLSFSKVYSIHDKFSKKEKQILKNSFTATTEIELPMVLPPLREIALGIRYQACSSQYCLLPKTTFVPLHFKDISSNAEKLEETNLGKSLHFDQALEKGLIFAFLFVFFAGILTSFTPCVFPMIPITLAVIGSRAAHISKWKAFSISLSYVFGIAATYSVIGIVAAKTGALFGALLSSPIVVGIICGVLIVMSLSMFGFFEVKTPQFISQSLMTKKIGQGHFGAFVAGLFAGIVASPCVGPVLVGILAFVAKSQDLLLGFGLLFVFALGLGMLFLVLGTFSSLIHYLPKSGPWMNAVKFVFGISMLALALYFALPVLPIAWITSIFGVATAVIGYLLGFQIPEDRKHLAYRRAVGSIAILCGILLLIFSASEYIKEQNNHQNIPSNMAKSHGRWKKLSKESLKLSQQNNRAVIIDFKADWCAACKELEKETFSTKEFDELSKDMDLYFVDATKITPEVNDWVEKYKILGLPTILFINNKAELREDLRLTGFEDIESFSKRMRSLMKTN